MASASPRRKVRCREIEVKDLDAIAEFLAQGFGGRPLEHWRRGLQRQSARAVPEGYPRYGYLLEAEGRPVGTILLMVSQKQDRGETCIVCNVSSWYVDPAFRSQGALLTAVALKRKDVTYINVTPARPTWPIIEAQGFRRYCNGLFFAMPALSSRGGRIEIVTADTAQPDDVSDVEFQLLTHHAAYGCLSLICRTQDAVLPFIFAPFRLWRGRIGLPAMQLAYCRDVSEFVTASGAIGRFLLTRGKPLVIIDANGPIAGLAGFYTEARGRKYFRGPHPPRLADLTETELVLYGH